MNINATLIGQSITFAIFVWFCMRFIWPPVVSALEARRKQIADGLAAADRGRHELELAAKRSSETLHEAKLKSVEVIAQAEKRANEIIEEAKDTARVEGERQLAAARAEIEQEVFRAREQLREQVAQLVVAGAEKILRREVDAQVHAELLEAVTNEL
jgi:F-type H+-transporting ATPase subunit b